MIINLKDYTIAEHICFATGCLLWVVVYIIVIRNIIKHKYIEVPVVAVCANVCWEFLWSFVFTTDMGSLYVWGYRIWFFLDCYIVYGMLRYGYKQMVVDQLKSYHVAIAISWIAAWMGMLYFYILYYDAPITKMGANSGYVLNVMMSALYIPLLLRQHSTYYFSKLAGWSKGVGTFLITIFCFLHFKDGFLLSMCVVTTILDLIYIIMIPRLQLKKN